MLIDIANFIKVGWVDFSCNTSNYGLEIKNVLHHLLFCDNLFKYEEYTSKNNGIPK